MAPRCQKAGCSEDASHALQLACGAYGDPDDAQPRAKILMGVLVCESCLDEETAERWLAANPALGQLLAISMNETPDLGRAVMLGVPLSDPEYRYLLGQQLAARN